MKLSLYAKFILAYLVFGIAGFVAIATLSSRLTYSYLIDERSKTLYDEANLIAAAYSSAYEGQNIPLQDAYPQLRAVATFLDASIWIVDREGKVVVNSQGESGRTIPDFDPTATGVRSYMVGNYFHSFSYDVLSVSAPIIGNYKTYGYVVIHLPMTNVTGSQYHILNIVYITSCIVFLLSLVILIVFQRVVYAPLKKITTAAREYAEGNLSYSVNIDSNDEMGYLAATLNFMSGELNESDQYQKRFITNISHDFRSPLTSIKGYLEAILDGTIPPDQQEKYLHRVIEETSRLNKLTESILSLHSFEKAAALEKTNFDINSAIRDTAESFEGQCSSKNITVELIFSDAVEIVFADASKILQVLYNLIDNAIKFSGTGSVIYVSTSVRREQVFVSVKDNGIGIAKKEQKKIFDRFYKSDSSRGRDKKGTGLGLAIVKEIIQAHGETIDVISTEGVGTEFIFSLPSGKEN